MTSKRRESRTSDDIVATLQQLQRDRDAIRDRMRSLNADLELALVAEGKAVSKLASVDLRDRDAREALRAQLDALDAEG